ncbi:MAG: transcription termination factor Rho [Desulfatiglans sp.]|jgi:cell division protein FtsX|nr:transcription termination factor Rho [Desulfatiglans sp.]
MAEEIKNEGAHPEAEEKPLDKMTAPELKEIAATIPGATGVTAMKKEELLALIKKHRGIEDETHAQKAEAAKKSLKSKLIDLRALKITAREEKNKKEVDILRRRINRLKKKTRKAG